MNIIVCGLNSYIGRASLQFLPHEHLQVHGIVRDQALLKSKLNFSTDARLYDIDIVRYHPQGININLPSCEVGFYFTQTPELNDIVGANYELLSVRNFIQFAQNNNCNRLIYVGTIYDRKHLSAVEELFKEFHVQYTIILKDVAIGKDTSFDDFMVKMMKNRFIYLYTPVKAIELQPVTLENLMNWIISVDWKTEYINQYVKYSGATTIRLENLMRLYQQKYSPHHKHFIIPIHAKHLSNSLNKYLSRIPYEQYISYITELSDRTDMKNIPFIKQISIDHTALLENI